MRDATTMHGGRDMGIMGRETQVWIWALNTSYVVWGQFPSLSEPDFTSLKWSNSAELTINNDWRRKGWTMHNTKNTVPKMRATGPGPFALAGRWHAH